MASRIPDLSQIVAFRNQLIHGYATVNVGTVWNITQTALPALLDAVRSGQVMAAGLDSFAVEPMTAGHPFQGEPRFILSPHIGGVTSDAYVNMGVGAARNALSVLHRTATV